MKSRVRARAAAGDLGIQYVLLALVLLLLLAACVRDEGKTPMSGVSPTPAELAASLSAS